MAALLLKMASTWFSLLLAVHSASGATSASGRAVFASERSLPRLVFEISEGFTNSVIQSMRDLGNFTVLEGQLLNIRNALAPLRDAGGFVVDVLIYPTHLYNQSVSAPLGRVHPNLHRALSFLENDPAGIGVLLEIYSSGVLTQQEGPRGGTLPPSPLRNQSDTRYLGLSMDVETVVALKAAYPRALTGVRFHEVRLPAIPQHNHKSI
jgi:hypothetical protein